MSDATFAQPMRIVVADDEPDMREYLSRILPRLGHEVVGTAADGVELLEFCDREFPDLVITDQVMPELSGDAAVERLWATRPVPVILISAFNPPEWLSSEADPPARWAHLAKPFSRGDLAGALADVLGTGAATG